MESVLLVVTALVSLAVGYFIAHSSARGRETLLKQQIVQLTEQSARLQSQSQDASGAKATLESLQKQIAELRDTTYRLNNERATTDGKLEEQLRQVIEASSKLEMSTHAMAAAFTHGQTRGQWGEAALEGIFTSAGLVEGVHFETQAHRDLPDSTVRPDVIVYQPDGTEVFIDSKFPFDAYWNSLQTTDLEEISRLQAKHVEDILKHVDALAKRKYIEGRNTPNFVVMFVPTESILSSALAVDGLLLQKAFDKNIVLASPTTMVGLLRTISFGWQRNKLARQTQQISDTAATLLANLGTLDERLTKIKRGLQSASEAYNDFTSYFDNTVFRSARELKDLGIASNQNFEPHASLSPDLRDPQGKIADLSVNSTVDLTETRQLEQ